MNEELGVKYQENHMEKIPAACAMEWSIELEKGLRCKDPLKSSESILQLGPRLEWWNKESGVPIAAYKMFDLIPGEGTVFANAILLRIAEAFRVGTKQIKTCIVKVFLFELRSRSKRRDKGGGGILSKNKLENYLEILRRVKMVFDEGDVERALALALFGCWAEIAANNADIRYLILSSLVSENILEVKASLFAAGCFCEFADDFAAVVLEILENMLTSHGTSLAFKIAGARAFPKLSCSHFTAQRAHMTGRKLLLDSTDEKFSTVMLISLTKVACRWTVMIPEQIDFLFSFLRKDKDVTTETTVFECLHFILAKGFCPCSATIDKIQYLFNRLVESQFPQDLHNQTLKVLHKILLFNFLSLPCSTILEFFSSLLKCVENMIQSSHFSTRLLALSVLVDIFEILSRRVQTESCKMDFSGLSQVVGIIMDHITLILELKLCTHEADMETYQEVMGFLNLLSNLVGKHSDVDGLLVDKLCVFLEYVVNAIGMKINLNQEGSVNFEISKLGQEKMMVVLLKVALRVAIVMTKSLENMETTSQDVTNPVLKLLQFLMEKPYNSAKAESYIIRLYLLLLPSNRSRLWQGIQQNVNNDSNSSPRGESFSEEGLLKLKCVRNLLRNLFGSRDFWSSYMAGKFAVIRGSWTAAACIFEQLASAGQSDLCSCWLKSLALFSFSESRIQRLTLVPPRDILAGDSEAITWKDTLTENAEKIIGTCQTLHAAKAALGSAVTGIPFGFQIWFLSLRVKFLETLADLSTLLGTVSFMMDGSSVTKEERVSIPKMMSSQGLKEFLHSSMQISNCLKRIAQELDLMSTSVIDMDRKGGMIVSALALSCSMLAFSLIFALSIPNFSSMEYESFGSCISKEHVFVALVEDFVWRLCSVDPESGKALWKLLKMYKMPNSCFCPVLHNQGAKVNGETKDYVKLCGYAVTEILSLQNELSRSCSAEGASSISVGGLQFLLSITSKLMQISFRTPKRFFLVRPNAASELYIMKGNGQKLQENPAISGSHLQLNLCLQLRYMPSDPLFVSKLYCILSFMSLPSEGDNEARESFSSGELEADNIIELKEKLLSYVNGSLKSKTGEMCAEDSYVCFDHCERGQGFATLLLDISAFPVGTYRIKWLSCCIDKEGSFWSLLPLNCGPVFSVLRPL